MNAKRIASTAAKFAAENVAINGLVIIINKAIDKLLGIKSKYPTVKKFITALAVITAIQTAIIETLRVIEERKRRIEKANSIVEDLKRNVTFSPDERKFVYNKES